MCGGTTLLWMQLPSVPLSRASSMEARP